MEASGREMAPDTWAPAEPSGLGRGSQNAGSYISILNDKTQARILWGQGITARRRGCLSLQMERKMEEFLSGKRHKHAMQVAKCL